MTVDATTPTGETLASDLPALIREEREEINDLWAAVAAVGGAASYETKTLAGGATSFALSGAGLIHTIALGASGPVAITDITGGVTGQLLWLKGVGSNVTLVHNTAKIHLNGGADYNIAENDFILLLCESNIWTEVFRTVHV